jgi:hypothetical protein
MFFTAFYILIHIFIYKLYSNQNHNKLYYQIVIKINVFNVHNLKHDFNTQ